MRILFYLFISSSLMIYSGFPVLAQGGKGRLPGIRKEFRTGSDAARTKLWWFHGETETTREGITADLEAFKREGVGGVVYYDQIHGKGDKAPKPFSKLWWEMFRFAATEAKRLGLTFETHLSNGYVSGGPWITEDLSMQRLEATDTVVMGGQHFNGKLPVPMRKGKTGQVRDVAVLAFPVPAGNWETSANLFPKISLNIGQFDAAAALPSPDNRMINIPAQKSGGSVYVRLEFGRPFTARSITYRVRARGKSRTGSMNMPGPPSETFYGYKYQVQPDLGELEVSEDGISYNKVCSLKPMYESPTWNQRTLAFPPVKGKYFRLNLHDWNGSREGQDLLFGNLVISAQAKMDQWEDKAALNSEFIENNLTPDYAASEVIDPAKIVDLTGKFDRNGGLDWIMPAGKWVIMRFFRTSIGVNTKHGPASLLGLESDKLSAAASKLQWNSYFKVMSDSLKKTGIRLTGLHMDSHEAGSQNWTIGFEDQFKKLRGYDIHKYLPALAGHVIGSKDATNGFLHDMRLTLSDLVSSEYFGVLDSLCRDAGVDFTAQAVGGGITMVADNFKAKGRVQKPQGEFWAYQTHGSYDVKEASSAAHIYGKPIASAEAFTDLKFSQSLAEAKNVADYAFAFGSQEFVVCASAYQPWLNKIPGNTGGGREYVLQRNNTFWNYSRPFWDYQARIAGLMRNGMAVVDLCVYMGEDAPLKMLSYRLPEIPEGYDFDVCTRDGLTTRISAKNGRLALPDGMTYQMLLLENKAEISLEALRHIAKLVKEGIAVHGARPIGSTSLKDAPFAKEYQDLVSQLWGKGAAGSKALGKGKVYWGMSVAEALARHGVKPDLGIKTAYTPEDKVYFAHRRFDGTDIYFLNNHSGRSFRDTIRLRTHAKHAEYWDPVTGLQYVLPVSASGNCLLLHIVLQPNESGFIITSDQPSALKVRKNTGLGEKATSIEGEWKVTFDPKWGGPGEVTFNRLTDWTENADERIKYYSGTAVYRKVIQFDKIASREKVLLRIPKLSSVARVILNGKEVSVVWCSPWEADLTPYIKKGGNKLEIMVANSLVNRMVGDASLVPEKRFTYAFPEVVTDKSSLVPSGILDSVLIVKQAL